MNPLTNPTAQGVDNVLIYIFGISLLMLLGITVAMIYLVIKYRRSKYPEPTSQVHSSFWLETLWTVLPTLIVLTMFWYGWTNYVGLRNVPEGALEVKATARMWSWQFEYPDGKKSNKLYVPVDQPVKVNLHSVDVLHSFFAPAFRIKRDAVPGMDTWLWFEAKEPGSYDIFCAEYCGTGHADMITTIEALNKEEYTKWASQSATPSGEPRGLTLIKELGCTGCHSLDGSPGIGPSLSTLSAHEQGEKITAEYLFQSIREPEKEIVEGYQPIMPAYGPDQISDEDLKAMVEYLMGKQEPSSTPKLDGHELMEDNGCLGCHSLDGSKGVAPTLKGIAGKKVKVMRDGKEVEITVDAEYLHRSIIEPKADIVEGYPPIMPAGDNLSKEEVNAIVEYLLRQHEYEEHGDSKHK